MKFCRLPYCLCLLLAFAAIAPTHAAGVKISDLGLSTAPSTNTYMEIADLNATGTNKSAKILYTNLVTQSQIGTNFLVAGHMTIGNQTQQATTWFPGTVPGLYVGDSWTDLNADFQDEGSGRRFNVVNKTTSNQGPAAAIVSEDAASETATLIISDSFVDNGTQYLRNSLNVQTFHYGPQGTDNLNGIISSAVFGTFQSATGAVQRIAGATATTLAYDTAGDGSTPIGGIQWGIDFLGLSPGQEGNAGATHMTNWAAFYASKASKFDTVVTSTNGLVPDRAFAFYNEDVSSLTDGFTASYFSTASSTVDAEYNTNHWAFYGDGIAPSLLNGSLGIKGATYIGTSTIGTPTALWIEAPGGLSNMGDAYALAVTSRGTNDDFYAWIATTDDGRTGVGQYGAGKQIWWEFDSANSLATLKMGGADSGALQTGTPSGGTAQPWKLGSVVTGATVMLVTTNYVQVDINGVAVKLAIVK